MNTPQHKATQPAPVLHNTPAPHPAEHKHVEPFKMIGNWDTQSKHLKETYSQLTDADLKFEAGKENELLGRVETRLHVKREEAINIIQKGQHDKK